MQEEWRTVYGYEDYAVSSRGQVVNQRFDSRPVRLSFNQRGICKVGLVGPDGVQRTLSMAVLVAQAFIPEDRRYFNTPIHLDFDRSNCHADNLMWRPRSIAVRYHAQDNPLSISRYRVRTPIEHVSSGRVYENSLEVVQNYGIIEQDLYFDLTNQRGVPPTGDVFRRVK